MIESLIQYIGQVIHLSPADEDAIRRAFTERKVKARTKLVNMGDLNDEFYYIHKGCIRKYLVKDGEIITLLIMTEGRFITEYLSFRTEQPSENVLETLEDCELLVLKQPALVQLYKDVPKMNVFVRKETENTFIETFLYLQSFIKDTPEERYRGLLIDRPEWIQRIPQHISCHLVGNYAYFSESD